MKKPKKIVSVAAETKKLLTQTNGEKQLLLPLLHKNIYSAIVDNDKVIPETSPMQHFVEPKPGFFRRVLGNLEPLLKNSKRRHLDLNKEMRLAFIARPIPLRKNDAV